MSAIPAPTPAPTGHLRAQSALYSPRTDAILAARGPIVESAGAGG